MKTLLLHELTCTNPLAKVSFGTKDDIAKLQIKAEKENTNSKYLYNDAINNFDNLNEEGYCPLCPKDQEGRLKYIAFLRTHLQEYHEVASEEALELQMHLKLSLTRELTPAKEATLTNPGVHWLELPMETRHLIMQTNLTEKYVTKEVMNGLTANNSKVYWSIWKDDASPWLLNKCKPSNSEDGFGGKDFAKHYQARLSEQTDKEEQAVAWLAFTWIGDECEEVSIRLDLIYVRKVYRHQTYGSSLFRSLATAYDGIYIEALYDSVPFFLKQADVFPLTNVQMLNDLRKFKKDTEPLLMKRVEKQLEDFGGPDLLNLSLRTLNRRLHKIVCMKNEVGMDQGAGPKKLVYMTMQYSPESTGVLVPESYFAELLVGGFRNSASLINDWNS